MSLYRVLSVVTVVVTVVAAVFAGLLVLHVRTPVTGSVLNASLALVFLWGIARWRLQRGNSSQA